MPYPTKPPWAVKLVVLLRTFGYIFTFMAGVAALVMPPNTISSVLPEILTVIWGWLLVVGSLVAIYGVIRRLFRFEFAALPFVLTGVLIYTATVVSLMGETPTRLTQVSILSALAVFFTVRFIDLVLVSHRLNDLHARTIETVENRADR